jgi:hypothetical protein
MATKSDSTTIAMINDTDAHFRAWCAFIDDLLQITGVWVKVTCTGETAVASLLHPTVANSKKGFLVYRMDDALQSTRPIYMRIDYASGGAANTPAIYITIGSGVNTGTGAITGAYVTDIQVGGNTSSATITHQYGSADTNRVVCAMGVATSNIGHFLFGIERSKDSNGNDTTDGLYFNYTLATDGGSTKRSQYINVTGGSQPPEQGGFGYVLAAESPSSFDGNVGISLVIMFAGAAKQPGTNFTLSKTGDFTAEGSFTLTVYGQVRTYQLLNASHNVVNNQTAAVDSDVRWGIRFD